MNIIKSEKPLGRRIKTYTVKIISIILAVMMTAVLLPENFSSNASSEDCYSYILPLKYEDVYIGKKYLYFKTGGKWGRASHEGEILSEAIYNSLDEALVKTTPAATKSSFTPFQSEKGKYGYKNGSGDVVIEPIYDIVANTFENGNAIVCFNGKYGIINTSGEVLFDFVCDTLHKSSEYGFYAYTQNERYGFINSEFKITAIPFLRAVNVVMHEDYVLYEAQGGKFGLASYDGKILTGAIWDYIRPFSEGLAAVGVNTDFYGINVRWGYINKSGTSIIPAIYDSYDDDALDFNEGVAGVCEGDSSYYIDKTGKIVLRLPAGVFPITSFIRGLAVVSENLTKYYINKSGDRVIEAKKGIKWYRASALNDNDIAVVSSSFDIFTSGFSGVIKYTGNTPSSWAAPEIEKAISGGFVPEDLRGLYTSAMTRAEYCRLAVSLIESYRGKKISEIVPILPKSPFIDTNDSYVLYSQSLGIVEGRGGGIFDPRGIINRQEAAKILVNTYSCCLYLPSHTQKKPDYIDSGKIENWAESGIWYMNEWGVMIGVGDNYFDPLGTYTREQSIITMTRLYDSLRQNALVTYYLSPAINIVDSSNNVINSGFDNNFILKISVPPSWTLDNSSDIIKFISPTGKTMAEIENISVWKDGPAPEFKTDIYLTSYNFDLSDNIRSVIRFREAPSADKKAVAESVKLYNHSLPKIDESLEDHVIISFERSREALSWFTGAGLSARININKLASNAVFKTNTNNNTSYSVTENNGFVRVGDYEIKNYSELTAYLNTLFNEKTVALLLEMDLYRDINGELYKYAPAFTSNTSEPLSARIPINRKIIRDSDKKIILSLSSSSYTYSYSSAWLWD